ncbi:MAG: C25 family peptidase propeptide domain-containing protein, partial [Bacteroidota bacterium]
MPFEILFSDSDNNNKTIEVNLNEFYSVVKNGDLSQTIIKVPGLTGIDSLNFPDLPKISFSLVVPHNGISSLKIIDEVFVDYPGYNIAGFDKVEVRDFVYHDPEITNNGDTKEEFWPGKRASLQPFYRLGEMYGQTIWLYPFAYNQVTQTLRVYSSITLEINYQADDVYFKTSNRNLTNEINKIYSKQFINYSIPESTSVNSGGLLILSIAAWIPVLQPLAEWKNQSGMETVIADISSISNDAIAIKNYIYNYYS